MQVKSSGLTHVGRQRQHNEDSFLVEDKARLYLVADGMGGHAAGEIASRIAVDSISEFILHSKEDDGTWPHAYDEHYRRSTNKLRLPTVFGCFAATEGGYAGGKADVTRLMIDKSGRTTFNLHAEGNGMLTEAEAEKHPLRNVITRALGGALSVNPDAAEVEVRSGDVYLLCSDGLTGMVPEDEILRVVTENEDDLTAACQRLIDTANERGGLDNITAILVKAL